MRAAFFAGSFAALCCCVACGARTELFALAGATGSAGAQTSAGGSEGSSGSGGGNACNGATTCVTPAAVCGDKLVTAPQEECDDGNTADGDGCSHSCAWEPVALSARGIRTCALSFNGVVKCWGDNEFGELGLGDTRPRGDSPQQMGRNLPPVPLGSGRTASAISAGYLHNCVLLDDGSVKCWGDNRFGGLGQGDTLTRGDDPNEMGDSLPAISLGTGQTALAIAAGDAFTCAILTGHTLKCWGLNYSGQTEQGGELGLGDKESRGDQPGEMGDALPFVDLGIGRTVNAISAGTDSACALLDNGSIKCWGVNQFGQLGQGDTQNRGDLPGEMGDNLQPVQLGAGHGALAVSVGYGFACALLDDGAVKCWGQNTYGQLGLGDTQNRGDLPGEMGENLAAVDLGPGNTAKAIAVGFESACALLDGGTVKCWGAGSYGQLGLGDSLNRGDLPGEMGSNLPVVQLGDSANVRAITSGYGATCALLADARVKCWGFNQYGELGLGDADSRGDDPSELGDQLPAVEIGF
jgi:cysteine-rich repeat protein